MVCRSGAPASVSLSLPHPHEGMFQAVTRLRIANSLHNGPASLARDWGAPCARARDRQRGPHPGAQFCCLTIGQPQPKTPATELRERHLGPTLGRPKRPGNQLI
jgi:hypothetical protein